MKLIINGDDFGLSESINNSIIDLIEKGLITSASILVKRDHQAFSHAIKAAKRLKNRAGFGLHLDLDNFFRFDESGNYGTNENDIIDNYLQVFQSNKYDIITEISSQIKTLKETGICISHLDSHHSIHQFIDIMQATIPLMKENSINTMRFNANFYKSALSLNFAKDLIIKNSIKITDYFYDLSEIISGNTAIHENTSDITEIMAHTDNLDNNYGRLDQYNYLNSNKFKNFELISYKDL